MLPRICANQKVIEEIYSHEKLILSSILKVSALDTAPVILGLTYNTLSIYDLVEGNFYPHTLA